VINGFGRKNYRAVTYAYDMALNKQFGPNAGEPDNADIPAEAGIIIQFDNDIPVTVTTTPANGFFANEASMTPLYGTASDDGVIDRIHVLVKAGDYTWKGTDFGDENDWDDSGGKYLNWSTVTYNSGEWSKALPSFNHNITNNRRIYVWTRGIDKTGNWEATPNDSQLASNLNADDSPAHYFTYDNSIPQTGILIPDGYSIADSTGLIKGTSYDGAPNPSAVSEVRIKLRRSDNAFWSWSTKDWEVSTGFAGTSGVNPWQKFILESSQEDGYQYDIYHFAKDYALNNDTGAHFSTFTFIVDMTTPTSGITFPAHNSFIGSVPVMTGVADDSVENLHGWTSPRNFEAGISESATDAVEIAIQRLMDDLWWDGGDFNSAVRIWSSGTYTGASSGTWTYNLPGGAIADGTTYYAMSRARDIVSNLQAEYT
ncbi:MAG: hypothetical protein KAI33_01735, partial [Elusimicrobiales bacterium]|nr:hypothetical protein [Elusimicrobiales bacterium]